MTQRIPLLFFICVIGVLIAACSMNGTTGEDFSTEGQAQIGQIKFDLQSLAANATYTVELSPLDVSVSEGLSPSKALSLPESLKPSIRNKISPNFAPNTSGQPNLALNASPSASSVWWESAGWGYHPQPASAIDENLTTFWHSRYGLWFSLNSHAKE